MSENQQTTPDPLEATIRAFTSMRVPQQPADEHVLARLGTRRHLRRWLVASAVAAGFLIVGLVLFLVKSKQSEVVQVTAPSASETARQVAVQPKAADKRELGERHLERMRLRPLEQDITEAQVIVVAKAVGSAAAPPSKIPGDRPENLLHFKVKRVLKGNPPAETITTQTPTAAAEFIGKDWIIMLSPDYLAGKHRYAHCMAVAFEPTVKAALANPKK